MPSAGDGAGGTRGARVIVLFPRPGAERRLPWWQRTLRWLRYGRRMWSGPRRVSSSVAARAASGGIKPLRRVEGRGA